MALVTCCRDMAAAPLAKAVFYTIAQWCRDAAAPLAEEHRDQARQSLCQTFIFILSFNMLLIITF